ncbi:RNA-directed DNA polymerase, eukaryota, reverse transcriptase zinc-binding domain protein, partial [Tanacetum coccineum]
NAPGYLFAATYFGGVPNGPADGSHVGGSKVKWTKSKIFITLASGDRGQGFDPHSLQGQRSFSTSGRTGSSLSTLGRGMVVYISTSPYIMEDSIGTYNPWKMPNEHSCRSYVMSTDMLEFQECLNKIEVEDICRSGLHFTWTKNLQKTKSGNMTRILKKLDRVMSNEAFTNKFPNAHAKFLPYLISDHTPILCIPTIIKKKIKAFRFSNYLTDKQEFIPILCDKWRHNIHGSYMYQVVKKMKSLKHPLKKLGWSKGNLFRRVELLRTQLQKVQTNIDIDPYNSVLRDTKANLIKKFYEAENDEEKFRYQQAKIKWLKEGDKNSSYFHKVLKGRNNRSKVLSLNDDSRHNYTEGGIPKLFFKHFKDFLGKAQPVKEIDNCETLFHRRISPDVAQQMISDVSIKEIKSAMFDINDSKAPGPDGFTAAFFKKAWSIVGEDICKAVHEFFISGRMLGELNATLISLIPKDFLKKTLEEFRFHRRMVHWIMECVTTIGFTLNVNGERIGYFKGGRGLRQALEEFRNCSGLLPNNSKSTIFFGSLNEEEKQMILNVIPLVAGVLLVKYLGVPLIAKRLSVKECGSLLDKIKSKVKIWKNRSLSYAGRLQLIAIVLDSIHVYWALVFLLPTTIIIEINRLLKWFLWNQGDTSKGKAKVAWKDICRPKDQGGLGLKNLQTWNHALLAKHIWNIAIKKILYGSNRDLIKDNVKCVIGNGNDASLWFDNWCNLGPLFQCISQRDLYDARLDSGLNLEVPKLLADTKDKLVWKNMNGQDMKFFSYGIESESWLSIIRRLAFAASIYSIWKERNGKVFKNNKRSCDDLFNTTVEMIKNKLSGIIVKDSVAVREIEVKWDISCQRATLKNSMGSVAASSNSYV